MAPLCAWRPPLRCSRCGAVSNTHYCNNSLIIHFGWSRSPLGLSRSQLSRSRRVSPSEFNLTINLSISQTSQTSQYRAAPLSLTTLVTK